MSKRSMQIAGTTTIAVRLCGSFVAQSQSQPKENIGRDRFVRCFSRFQPQPSQPKLKKSTNLRRRGRGPGILIVEHEATDSHDGSKEISTIPSTCSL